MTKNPGVATNILMAVAAIVVGGAASVVVTAVARGQIEVPLLRIEADPNPEDPEEPPTDMYCKYDIAGAPNNGFCPFAMGVNILCTDCPNDGGPADDGNLCLSFNKIGQYHVHFVNTRCDMTLVTGTPFSATCLTCGERDALKARVVQRVRKP
jgi:hypothetical protein